MIKHFLKFSLGGIVSAIISFFTTPIVTALIIPNEFGKATMFTLISSLLSQFILLSSDQSFMRFFYEKSGADRTGLLWNCIYPTIVVFFTVSIILYVSSDQVSFWICGESSVFYFLLLLVNVFVIILERFSSLVVRMQQNGMLFSLSRILISIINFIIVLLFASYISASFEAIIVASIVSLFSTSVVLILIEYKFWFNSEFKFEKKLLKDILCYSIPLIPTCLMAMLFDTIDKFFLRGNVSFSELGIYSAVYKIVGVLTIVQTGFSMFWTPFVYDRYEKEPHDSEVYARVFEYLLCILTIGALCLITFKDYVILILNEDYRSAAQIIPFLLFIPIMYTLSEVTTIGINLKKKTYLYIIIFFIVLVFSLLFNYILIRNIGAKGAAMAVALSYVLYFTLRTMISKKYYLIRIDKLQLLGSLSLLIIISTINESALKSGIF